MSIKITGLDQLKRKLEDLSRKAESIGGEHSVPMGELLTPAFLEGCTLFNSADELFEKSGFNLEAQADFAALPDDAWDEFIRGNTSFASWKEMLQAAGAAYVQQKLDFE